MTSSKIGFEIKIVIEDLTASDVTSKLQSLVQQINGLINLASAAPSLRAEPLSVADAVDNALEAKLAEHKPTLVTTTEAAAATRKTRTKVAAPAPVEAPLKQGDKTATIRNFVASNPAGVSPKEILKYLRTNFLWARESTTLANTVHTSLNNMIRRGLVSFDKDAKLYTVIAEATPRAPGRPTSRTDAEAVPAGESDTATETASADADATDSVEIDVDVDAENAEPVVEVASAVEPVVEMTEEELAAKAAELRANQKPVPGLFDLNG